MSNSSRAKTAYVAQLSIEEFFNRNRDVYFLTFTEPGRSEGEPLWTKDQAEDHFKPFADLCRRRNIALLVVWERQQRGAWHPHCLVNKRFDVNWLRPWMVERGWGHIMRLEWVTRHDKTTYEDGKVSHTSYMPGASRIVRYLTKYLTKGIPAGEGGVKKKRFCCSRSARAGGVTFKWVPWVRPGAMLYNAGLEFFKLCNDRRPRFRDMREVIRLGVESTGWAHVDPWWDFGFP